MKHERIKIKANISRVFVKWIPTGRLHDGLVYGSVVPAVFHDGPYPSIICVLKISSASQSDALFKCILDYLYHSNKHNYIYLAPRS